MCGHGFSGYVVADKKDHNTDYCHTEDEITVVI